MTPAFERRLDRVVRRIVPEGRAQTAALIASVVDAGGDSERALVEMLGDRSLDATLRANVCWLLARLNAAGAADALGAALSDPSQEIRQEAAAGLGLVGGDDDVEALVAVVERDRSAAVRSAALHALGVLSSPRTAEPLMRLVRNPEEAPEIRADAAEALAHVRDGRVVDALVGALADGSPLVRYSAAYALGQQGDARAVPALAELAADQEMTPWGSVASSALEAIDAIGDQAP